MRKARLLSLLSATAVAVFTFVSMASADPWKFGVMSDTQWISQTSGVITNDTRAPNSVPVDIIKALNQQFIKQGVKLVIQVGDLCDSGAIAGEDGRAVFAQDLYNAGIGFFPFRGNHDASQVDALEFIRIYPQTQGGNMNATPLSLFNATISGPNQTLPAVTGSPFPMGSNFSSPILNVSGVAPNSLVGLSYSFDYAGTNGNTVRFVMLDGQAGAGIDNKTPGVDPQQSWITAQLSGRPAGSHAFVLSHKGLITENHVDVLFGSYPYSDAAGRNAFFSSLYGNGVRYYINGHDHMHDRSRINSPDGTSYVNQLLCASDSSKFYTPGYPLAQNNDILYDTPANGISGPRQTMISQELYTVGYYIFTVDGPKVTVDYYSAPTNNVANSCSGSKCEHLITDTAAAAGNVNFLNFVKAETFGYSLNGKEFLVPQGGSYTAVSDSIASGSGFFGTTAKILNGKNGSTAKDFSTRALTKAVDTGWTAKPAGAFASDVLTLWGMADLYGANPDTYALSVSYDPSITVSTATINAGKLVYLATKDANNNWVKAAGKKFILGPYNANYPLGTYGVDPATHTAWAVVNNTGDFAVISQ